MASSKKLEHDSRSAIWGFFYYFYGYHSPTTKGLDPEIGPPPISGQVQGVAFKIGIPGVLAWNYNVRTADHQITQKLKPPATPGNPTHGVDVEGY